MATRNPKRFVHHQPGFRQNLSGSETDVSTSNENLTVEEKRVLQNGIRQEPQGEETIADESDTVSSNTLIIHEKMPESPFYGQNYNSPEKSALEALESEKRQMFRIYTEQTINPHISTRNNPPVSLSPNSVHRPFYSNLQKSPIHNNWEYSQSGDFPNNQMFTQNVPYHLINPYQEQQSIQGIKEIPKDYLDQSEVLKYLAKELNHPNFLPDVGSYSQGMPVADHPQVILGNVRRRGYGISKSADRLILSQSHPDLSRTKHFHSEDNSAKICNPYQRQDIHGRQPPADTDIAMQANQMIELLTSENTALKSDLDMYYKKVSKLQKFELEIQKVHKAYEDLVHSSEKSERLERSIRTRLEMEIRRLHDQNKDLRDYFEATNSQTSKLPFSDVKDNELRKELSKREVLIAQLLTQTKELLAEKERQEIELQAQRATLQEQRNHIDILENALTNAQANVVRLEEESRKKQVYVDRVSQLQKALTNLQQSSEKRLLVERKLRAQHEKEVQALKSQMQGKSSFSKSENADNVESLKKTVMEYEEKIIGLEAEVSKWEQRYIEESTMRQIAVDAASVPKDAKIAALERTSQESEKLIAQARTEKLKQMDELYAANRKCTELESRIKDFESKLAEKDAMIKVLQQHSQEKDAVLQNAVLGRPPRHTRAASTVGITTSTCHTTTTTGVSSLGQVSPSPTNTLHRRTGSASGSLLSISSDSSSTVLPSQPSPIADSVMGSKKSLDEQLKELDSRLSRFNHKRSTSRERKISKSLLESMKDMICN